MDTRLRIRPLKSAILCGALTLSSVALAQNAGTQKTAAATSGGEDQYPDLVEIDPFGGVSTWGQVNKGLTTHLVTGGIAGIRGAVNPAKHFGIEGFFEFSQANVQFRSSTGTYPPGNGALTGTPIPTYAFGSRNYTFGLGPVFNLTPRGSRVQPYLTVGVAGIQFTPTTTAKGLARQAAVNNIYHSANLNDNLQVGVFYGGGIKFHLTDHFGLRVDARGITSRNPTYGLPNYNTGGIYIPSKSSINNFQGTIGLVWYLGQSKCPEMPPAPPPPAPLATPTISGGEGTICQGKPVTLHANIQATGNQKLSYAWTLNGQTQGSDSPEFTFTPNNTGSFNVQLTVKDTTPPPPPMEKPAKFPVRCWVQPPTPPPPQPVTATATVTVNESAPQVSSVTANPNTLACAANTNGTHTAQLTGNATSSACGGNLTYKWTVSEGSVTGDTSANATFDASTLNFEAGAAQNQSKTVTATLTVTDEAGKTASQSTTITVNCEPQFVRLDDVVFAKNNSRVNNCGKRLLIDDAANRLSSGDYDIVLVGHRDSDEAENGTTARARVRRRAATPPTPLDEQRVLNAAAVLSGGTGTCGKIDPSRIRVDWVGTDQTSDTRPGQCGTSNVKERKGSQTTEADKNRRVELYLVPRGSSSLPPAVKNIKPLPQDQVKALGCPK